MTARCNLPWTVEQIETLTALWAVGHSAAEIGRRMGISKNAVIGKAHRLRLDGRQPCVKKISVGLPLSDKRYPPKTTLLPLLSLSGSDIPSGTIPVATTRLTPGVPASEQGSHIVFYAPLPPRACCYPFGEPRTPEFRFCEAPTATVERDGVTVPHHYCAEHKTLCSVSPKAPPSEFVQTGTPSNGNRVWGELRV